MSDNKHVINSPKLCQRPIAFQKWQFCIPKVPVLRSKTVRFAFQKWQFCIPKWCVLQSKMVRFATQNGVTFHPFAMNRSSKLHYVNGSLLVFDMRNLMSENSVFFPLCTAKHLPSHCINMQNPAFLCKNSLKNASFLPFEMLISLLVFKGILYFENPILTQIGH